MLKCLNTQSLIVVFLCSILFTATCHGATKVNNNTSTKQHDGSSPFDIKSMISGFLPSSGGDIRKQASQALGFLKYAFIGAPKKYTPNAQCLDNVIEFFKAVLAGEMWALKSK